MNSNLIKSSLTTLSAKISVEAKADFEEKATKAGMVKSDYLRLILKQAGIGVNHEVMVVPVPKQEVAIVSNYEACNQNQQMINQTNEIAKKEDVILKNVNNENGEMFLYLTFVVAILVIGCACLSSD